MKAYVWKERGRWWAVAPGFTPVAFSTWRVAFFTARLLVMFNRRRWGRRWSR